LGVIQSGVKKHMTEFSDFIIYADESGDHHLEKINPEYPVFCLALCIVKKADYINKIVPAIQQLKFDYWGHDKIVLHEREIRKEENDFAFLRTDRPLREGFFKRVNQIVKDASFLVVSSVIKKEQLREHYSDPFNPYHIALKLCMEQVVSILLKEGQMNKKIFCIFERRGKKEDEQLELEFYRIINNQNTWGYKEIDFNNMNFELRFAGKEHNSTGLQLADLVARPIALKVLKPEQENRAYEILKEKYYNGYENKSFP